VKFTVKWRIWLSDCIFQYCVDQYRQGIILFFEKGMSAVVLVVSILLVYVY
jgi:hypothetical protein